MYVMEAEVLPHTRCLWFQVRNHAILGVDVLCLTYYCKLLLQRAPGLNTVEVLCVIRRHRAIGGTLLQAYFGFHFSLPLLILLCISLSLLQF